MKNNLKLSICSNELHCFKISSKQRQYDIIFNKPSTYQTHGWTQGSFLYSFFNINHTDNFIMYSYFLNQIFFKKTHRNNFAETLGKVNLCKPHMHFQE